MDKFKMELTWHNCKTCPPKEDKNDFLVATDGKDVFNATWDRLLDRYYIKSDCGCSFPLFSATLKDWWWGDIIQTVRNASEFKEV